MFIFYWSEFTWNRNSILYLMNIIMSSVIFFIIILKILKNIKDVHI